MLPPLSCVCTEVSQYSTLPKARVPQHLYASSQLYLLASWRQGPEQQGHSKDGRCLELGHISSLKKVFRQIYLDMAAAQIYLMSTCVFICFFYVVVTWDIRYV